MSTLPESFVTPVFRYVFQNTTNLLRGIEVANIWNDGAWMSVFSLFEKASIATGIPYSGVIKAYIHQDDPDHALMHLGVPHDDFSVGSPHAHMVSVGPLSAHFLNLTLSFLNNFSLNATARVEFLNSPIGGMISFASGFTESDTETPLIDPPELPLLIRSYRDFLKLNGVNLEQTCTAESFLEAMTQVSEPEAAMSFWVAGLLAMGLVGVSRLLLSQCGAPNFASSTSFTLGVAAFIALAPQASVIAMGAAVLASATVSVMPVPSFTAETAVRGRQGQGAVQAPQPIAPSN